MVIIMSYELGNVYVGHIVAKNMMHEALHGKPKQKKISFVKRIVFREVYLIIMLKYIDQICQICKRNVLFYKCQ